MDHFLDDSVDDDDDGDDDDDDDHDDADEDEDSDEDGDDNRVVPVTSLDFCSSPLPSPACTGIRAKPSTQNAKWALNCSGEAPSIRKRTSETKGGSSGSTG